MGVPEVPVIVLNLEPLGEHLLGREIPSLRRRESVAFGVAEHARPTGSESFQDRRGVVVKTNPYGLFHEVLTLRDGLQLPAEKKVVAAGAKSFEFEHPQAIGE